MKVLFLTVKKEPFEQIKLGKKKEEYREPSYWILSRLQESNDAGTDLVPRKYDVVKFQNGYKPDSPTLTVEYKGFYFRDDGIVVIKLGKIIH
jgi:hypothetical protein